jgi:hypothetical protein
VPEKAWVAREARSVSNEPRMSFDNPESQALIPCMAAVVSTRVIPRNGCSLCCNLPEEEFAVPTFASGDFRVAFGLVKGNIFLE